MIIVTGASGKLGRAIVENLVRRGGREPIGVSVRDPSRAAELAALGVRVRRGDFSDPQSLGPAFEGASQLLIVSSNGRATGSDPLVQHQNAIDAARAAGVRRIIYTSQISASPTSAFSPGLDHAATEAMLRGSGMTFTSLRNGFYAAHAAGVVREMLETGESVAPADGKISWTAHADLAEAAAALVADDGRFEGATPPLTGSEALDLADLAALASQISGRSIRHVTLSDEDYRARRLAQGTPAHVVDFIMGMFLASRRGEFAAVDPTLEQLLGRRPIKLREILAR